MLVIVLIILLLLCKAYVFTSYLLPRSLTPLTRSPDVTPVAQKITSPFIISAILYLRLKSKIPNDFDIPNPLILGGSGANDFSKNQRLKEHLKVAEQNGLLSDASEYLSKIPDSQWVKSDGNLDPNELDYWQLDELHRKELKDNGD